MMVDQELMDAVSELAATAGFHGPLQIERWRSTTHNRLWRVDVGEDRLVLKRYFPAPQGRRERLRAEFTFSRFAWARGIRNIPRPIAADYTRCMGLFQFVEGRPLRVADIDRSRIEEASTFLARLNHDPTGLDARALPTGLKAARSAADEVRQLEARLHGLQERAVDPRVDPGVRRLVEDLLVPAWQQFLAKPPDWGVGGSTARVRCVSPSDFGFHNALVGPDGGLVFLDFEYAGWDDPTRVVGEMFVQADLPVPMDSFPSISSTLGLALGQDEAFADRVRAHLPLLRIERCCELLHELLPIQGRRPVALGAPEANSGKRLALQRTLNELLGTPAGS